MQNIENLLEELEIPVLTLDKHRILLRQKLLDQVENNQKKTFLEGGEFMNLIKSQIISNKQAIGFFVIFVAIIVGMQLIPFGAKNANAQELVKKALTKVSQLPKDQQQNFLQEKEKLEKAQKAKDLHIVSSSQKNTILKFTDNSGNEETIELGEDDAPVVGVSPSISPTPKASSGQDESEDSLASPSPTNSGIRHSVNISGEDSNKGEDETNENSVSGNSSNEDKSESTEKDN